ncbi:MAG TPA: hypothetical protein IAC60_04015 [Candidatus Enterosoma merdigallinarum]|nr:hypothetical protein [Candidatus Enterosoma merdigallinarum]
MAGARDRTAIGLVPYTHFFDDNCSTEKRTKNERRLYFYNKALSKTQSRQQVKK